MTKMIKKTSKKSLTKKSCGPLTTPGAPHGIKIKHVMLLDTGDGAYTDQSVKVKPHKSNPKKLCLKCTDAKRLLDAVKRMGLTVCSPMIRGSKHFILFVWKNEFGDLMLSQGHAAMPALPAPTAKPVKAPKKQKVLTGTVVKGK